MYMNCENFNKPGILLDVAMNGFCYIRLCEYVVNSSNKFCRQNLTYDKSRATKYMRQK